MILEKTLKEFTHQVMKILVQCLISLIKQTKLDVHFDEPNYFHFETANGLTGKIPGAPTFSSEKKLEFREVVHITPIIL